MGVWLILGCDEPFEYHPYDLNLKSKYRDINRKNIERIRALETSKDTVRFIWMGDTQRWYDETEDFVAAMNQRNDIDFVIHGGDISDFGMKKEFCWIHDIMEHLNVPYVAIFGNHDNLGSGLSVYEAMYGDLNFSFVFGGVKFICLNTNALEFDYSVPVPDFEFLSKEVLEAENAEFHSTVVAMHAQPFCDVFNNNVNYVFQKYINSLKNLRFTLHAHSHKYMDEDLFEDGVRDYGCASMKHRSCLLFTLTKDDYTHEELFF